MKTRQERFAEYYDSRSHREVVENLIDAEDLRERQTKLLHSVQKIARDRTAEAQGRRDHAEKIKKEVLDLHEPFPIYPVVWYEEEDVCNHCGESVADTWGHLHDEDSEGSQYELCLAKGPSYLVCRECSNDGADEVPYPCATLRIFGVTE